MKIDWNMYLDYYPDRIDFRDYMMSYKDVKENSIAPKINPRIIQFRKNRKNISKPT
jgi:hypothetical protein